MSTNRCQTEPVHQRPVAAIGGQGYQQPKLEHPAAVDPGPALSVSDAPPPQAVNPPSPSAADANAADADSREVRLEKSSWWSPKAGSGYHPRSRSSPLKFDLPRVEGYTRDGQLTITKVPNFDPQKLEGLREQFAEQAKDAVVQQLEISGVKVTALDVSGTSDKPEGELGAVAGAYRVLSAMFLLEGKLYLVNCSGPQKTIDKYAEEFHAFLQSMKPGESS